MNSEHDLQKNLELEASTSPEVSLQSTLVESVPESYSELIDEFHTDQLFTPESFSPYWLEPTDLLGFNFELPYQREEWDYIFETLLNLLDDPDSWIWEKAIAQLLTALGVEATQDATDPDYQPCPLQTRSSQVFEAIVTLGKQKPALSTRTYV